ncbi:MAG: M23 family metallopeptidase [Chloroflexi bacterium]|nr:M23 family metallopeptidase [Chloroflexota bacterium]
MRSWHSSIKDILNKRRFWGLIVLIVLVTGGTFLRSQASYDEDRTQPTFSVRISGQTIGFISEPQQVLTLLAQLTKEASERTGYSVTPLEKVIFEPTISLVTDTPAETLRDSLGRLLTFKYQAVGLAIGGQIKFYLASREQAENVLQAIKDFHARKEESVVLESQEFEETINFVEAQVDPSLLEDPDRATGVLLQGTEKIEQHVVKSGESLWKIASERQVPIDVLREANPEVEKDLIRVGQRLKLVVPNPYLHVATSERISYRKTIPYQVSARMSSELWAWESRILEKGKPGVEEVVARVKRINDQETSREIISVQRISDPKTEIVLRGTRRAPRRGTGEFIWPLAETGQISSPYGKRGRGLHSGVDIAAATGTGIMGGDDGTVTFAGWKGNYGLTLVVDHGNGYQTLYAHNSKLLASVGSSVKKGQVIALVGSTGRSTGPHLHFEIWRNETAINPMNFFE